ncbi:cytochrome P450 CYP82D47-like [Papaver somniferum]|uniref:cytochrome P450 CYP82D47-like n=1 Tax=Papaver somniferum TaxID=3469 RepID=UPI000E6FBEFA|nr:cytochrome P450 CYP82D47-like [Papaver somniferum]
MELPIFNYQYFWSLPIIPGLLAFVSFLYYLHVLIISPRNIRTNNNIDFHKAILSGESVPEVAGAWPILGHLPQLVKGSKPLFKILGEMSDKYGPIFMVRIGMNPTLVVSSWEMSKECFITNDKFLATRPASAAGKYLYTAFFGFSSYGPYWQEIRKISTFKLLSPRRIELLKNIPYLEIGNCIKRLHQCCMKDNIKKNDIGAAGSARVDMTQVFEELTLNVVLQSVVGKPLYTKNDDDHECTKNGHHDKEEEEGQKLRKTIIGFTSLAGVSVASDVLPFLGWLDLDGQKKKMKRVSNEMSLVAEKWLEEHRLKKRLQTTSPEAEGGSIHDDVEDFMGELMSVLDEEKGDLFFGYSRDTVIKATCLQLIAAASDSTSLTMTWALSLLLTNLSVLRKAQDELDTKVGKDRNVEGHDITDLIYLQAIVKETLRLCPPAPLAVPHEAIEDCHIKGYKVKAGTRLVVNLWKLHRDPRVWSNPLEFKPERFLPQLDGGVDGEAKDLNFWGQDPEYIPFGSGRRMCPGINFSLQTMHMLLARLLHSFDFDTTGLVIDMTEGSGLTLPRLTPLEVYLQPRLPVTLY